MPSSSHAFSVIRAPRSQWENSFLIHSNACWKVDDIESLAATEILSVSNHCRLPSSLETQPGAVHKAATGAGESWEGGEEGTGLGDCSRSSEQQALSVAGRVYGYYGACWKGAGTNDPCIPTVAAFW